MSASLSHADPLCFFAAGTRQHRLSARIGSSCSIPAARFLTSSPVAAKEPRTIGFVEVLAMGAGFAGGVAFASRKRSMPHKVRCAAMGNWPESTGGSAAEVLQNVKWPDAWPYTAEDFSRQDETDDTVFYNQPRLCTHVDDSFISELTKHYAKVFPTYPNARILDICSSWISHYPQEKCWSHVSITGMNEYELSQNKQADDYTVRNLNVQPELPYENESFDIVTCTVSFDYLNKPLEVMKEVARVLKPGGTVILSTSNRCFPTKAVKIWLNTNDMGHVLIYGSYMHYTGQFEAPEGVDLSPPLARIGFADPVYVIQAKKKA